MPLSVSRRSRLLRNGLVGGALLLAASPTLVAAPAVDDNPLGRKVYNEQCASCHGVNFGGAFGPPVSGDPFVARWKDRSPQAFADHVLTMPPAAPGSLTPEEYDAVTRLIQDFNKLPKVGDGATPTRMTAPDQVGPQAMNNAFPVGDYNGDAYKAAKAARQAKAAALAPVTEAMLADPDPKDWLNWRRTRDSHAFSPLAQIDRGNVAGLSLAWALPLGAGTNAIAPLAYDGVMFINANGTVRALDAISGEEIWRFERPATTTRVPLSQARGIAIHGNAIYTSTIDNHVVALDMRSGKVLWDTKIAGPEGRLQTTAAPLIAKGKVIQGVSGCQGDAFPGGCYIVALDAETGKEAWRFHTIARPGEKGGDSWNGAPLDKRFGGSIWTAPSYDEDTGLLYFGTAQTYIVATLTNPGGPDKPGSKDALHTNSTLAIDPETGKLAWSYQHFPSDIWDLDWSFEQTIVTIGGRKAVVTIGKLGIVDAVDAKTGKYLWSLDIGLQNLVTAIDPKTGRKTFDASLIPEKGKIKMICPSALGVRNWLATAADPTTGRLFVPMVESCMNIGVRDTGSGPTGDMLLETRTMPGNDGQYGQVAAIDLATRKVVWQNRRRAPAASAILATGGGLVFEGSLDRWFRALDSASGEVLWQARLDDSPHAFPITYMAGGTQYVAIVTGGGTPHDLIYRSFTPEFSIPARQRTLWVFKLPGK